MGIFGGGPKCRPPNEYDSYECWRRYWEPRYTASVRIQKFNASRLASQFRRQGQEATQRANISTKLAQDKITKLAKETNERWTQIARSQTGATGRMAGEFKADTPTVKLPKAKKIKQRLSPSVQIAGLESKAVTEGTFKRKRSQNEKRPI